MAPPALPPSQSSLQSRQELRPAWMPRAFWLTHSSLPLPQTCSVATESLICSPHCVAGWAPGTSESHASALPSDPAPVGPCRYPSSSTNPLTTPCTHVHAHTLRCLHLILTSSRTTSDVIHTSPCILTHWLLNKLLLFLLIQDVPACPLYAQPTWQDGQGLAARTAVPRPHAAGHTLSSLERPRKGPQHRTRGQPRTPRTCAEGP